MRTPRPSLWVVWLGLACFGLTACGSEPELRQYPEAVAQGVDSRGLASAYQAFAASDVTQALLVERNGVVVMEEYFNGGSAAAHYDVRSVTKSVTSILIGIAIDQGRIGGVHETIGPHLGRVLPDLETPKAQITIEQLLTMTSGLPWNELNSEVQDYGPFVSSPDPLIWILSKPFEREPGTYWHYNNAGSHILSAILTQATGMSAREFARQQLFVPMGEEVGPWPADPRGYNYGGHGISLTGRALVKMGRLVLDGGVYQGRRLVSADWVREATATRWDTHTAVPWGTGYGYHWWTGSDSRAGLSFFMALGYGGQFVIDVPSRNTVIVATTRWSGVPHAGDNWYYVLRTIIEHILPSLHG